MVLHRLALGELRDFVGILLACLMFLLFVCCCCYVEIFMLFGVESFVSNLKCSLDNVYFSVVSSGHSQLLTFASDPRFSHPFLIELGGCSLFGPVISFPAMSHSIVNDSKIIQFLAFHN